jgi:hypothetical protein
MRKIPLFVILFALAVLFVFSFSLAQNEPAKELSKEQIVSIATMAVTAKGIKIDEVQIIYDDGNKLWEEQTGKMTELVNSPNFGIFKKGFMSNYRTVYFDFKDPLPDIWVFIDKDTGEVLEVYAKK